MFHQGDIVLVPFPFTDLKQSKPRPAVVISQSIVNKGKDAILAQISSQSYNDDFSYQIQTESLSIPLQKVSQVRCHKIFTVEKSLVYKTISSFKKKTREDLLKKICSILEPEK